MKGDQPLQVEAAAVVAATACPHCGASVGAGCVTRSGRPTEPHVARFWAKKTLLTPSGYGVGRVPLLPEDER